MQTAIKSKKDYVTAYKSRYAQNRKYALDLVVVSIFWT
jgi:hypothetical protein